MLQHMDSDIASEQDGYPRQTQECNLDSEELGTTRVDIVTQASTTHMLDGCHCDRTRGMDKRWSWGEMPVTPGWLEELEQQAYS